MSGIAEVLVNLGYEVRARTSRANAGDRAACAAGRARSSSATPRSNVAGADVVVVSRPRSQPTTRRCVAARDARIPVVRARQMLAELMRFKQGIAVAGTHGKTTTTSLVASVLAEGGARSDVRDRRAAQDRRHQRAARQRRLPRGRGRRDRRLVPAPAAGDRGRHQHRRRPHGDLRRRLREAEAGFVEFLHNLPFYGLAVLCIDDADVRAILPQVSAPDGHLRPRRGRRRARGRRSSAPARMRFAALRRGHARRSTSTLNLPGAAQRAQRAGGDRGRDELGVADAAIQRALAEFPGRRPALPALRRGRDSRPGASRWSTTTATTRPRWRRRSTPRARPFPAGAWCSRSSRTATRARATCSRTSCACSRGADALVLTEVYSGGRGADRGRRRPRARRAVRGRGQGRAGVRRGRATSCAAALAGVIARRRRRGHDGRRLHRRGRARAAGRSSACTSARAGHERRSPCAPECADRVLRDEPMARHTCWRAGGPADVFFTPRDVDDLAAFLRSLPADEPVTFVGLGSNLLVRDGGCAAPWSSCTAP